jgi:putative heme-binding domain-containing protein
MLSLSGRAAAALTLLLLPFLVSSPAQAQDPYAAHVARVGPRTPEEERKAFHVPPGFEVQLVAAEPYVRKPINLNFDDRGRLWVTESVEYPFPAGPNARHRDSVAILEDTNGDGRADEVTTFTGGLNIPIGVLPLRRGALVYSIPYVYRFHDDDGDGRADRREVLYQGYGHRDTHGMTGEFAWGFDGWVYACHGFSNTSKVRAKDGSAVEMQSGNTYRLKADGSHIEQFTHGQVNPFGLAFDPLGNLYSCDCHSRPVYQLLRGAYYPSFGKPHDGLGFGPEMMTHDHGSTAIAGIAYYAADHFPAPYRDSVYVGNVVTNRINYDRIAWHGSSPKAIQQPDFLVSDDPWFRPVDIKLGPDGALYVADFYNRIIGHYEVPLTHPGRDRERGRIWRVVYRGTDGKAPAPKKPRADWDKASTAALVQDLGHPNLTVRLKATNQLADRGGQAGVEAVRTVMKNPSHAYPRIHGLWVLERCGALDESLLEAMAHDKDRGVRVHALRVLSERRQLSDLDGRLLCDGLKDEDPFVRRAAAEALGTHPAAAHVRPLLDLYHVVPADDTHLRHMVRMALREQLRPASAWAELPLADWGERDLRALADVAPGVPSPEAAAFLMNHLRQRPESPENQIRYVYHVARYAPEAERDQLTDYVRAASTSAPPQRIALFRALLQGTEARGAKLNPQAARWVEELIRQLLASRYEREALAGIELCGSLKLETLRDPLLARAGDRRASQAQRSAALAALVSLDPSKAVPVLGRSLTDAATPLSLRERSAQLLAGIGRAEAREELVKGLVSAPGRLETAIAVGLAGSRAGAEKLFAMVAAGKASARLLQDRQVEVRLAASNLPDWKGRLEQLTQGLPAADQRLQELLRRRRRGYSAAKGDAAAGAKIFEKNCAICHQLANQGAKIGPQLDGIGLRGVDRLLEDILDPNRNVDQAFRLTTLNLTNGQTVSGLLLREEGEVLVLADAQGKEQRHPKSAVAERLVSQLSPMPANLADLPEADFYHLLAYLLAQQKK